MISAKFSCKNNLFCSFEICGHAGYSHSGKDIVCASVSSAVMLTANLITEYFHIPAKVSSDENKIIIDGSSLKDSQLDTFNCILKGLYDHLSIIQEDFPRYIKLKHSEV